MNTIDLKYNETKHNNTVQPKQANKHKTKQNNRKLQSVYRWNETEFMLRKIDCTSCNVFINIIKRKKNKAKQKHNKTKIRNPPKMQTDKIAEKFKQ